MKEEITPQEIIYNQILDNQRLTIKPPFMKKEIQEEIDNKIREEMRNGDTETLEEMAQRIKDEDIEPPKKGNIRQLIREYKSQCLEDRWLEERIKSLLAQEKQKWDKDHELLVNAIIDTYKMKIKDLKQQYRQEILEGLPKEKELENENIAGLTNARTRNDQKTGYNQALQEIKELINKI